MRVRPRPAVPGDYATFVRLFAELAVPDPVPSPTAFEAMQPGLLMYQADDGAVVAYTLHYMYGRLAHLGHIVVAPEARGHGVGAAVMSEVAAVVRAAGATCWFLNVKQDNVAALRVYERAGMRREHPAWALDFAWSRVARLPEPAPVRTSRLVATPLTAADDAVAATLTKQAPERLALMRERGRVMLALREPSRDDRVAAGETLVACAAFDPKYPGIYPIAVARPGLERPLLEALRAHADPAHGDLVRITLDADEALVDRLVAAGAKVSFALWRLVGDPADASPRDRAAPT